RKRERERERERTRRIRDEKSGYTTSEVPLLPLLATASRNSTSPRRELA
ncbi:hypothetical protein TSAR_008717, partial [Trichomalopsis sarcophagae]